MSRMPDYLRMVWRALLVLCLLTLLPAAALAAKISDIWVAGAIPQVIQDQAGAKTLPPDAIHWWYSERSEEYYLFLPSGADTSRLQLWYEATEQSITIDGKTLRSGDEADLLIPGTKYTVTCGNKSYPLTVMQSKNVPAMFIQTESGSLKSIHASRDNKETGFLSMLNADGSMEYVGKLTQMKGRGHSSFANAKKPYQIKLDKSTDLCGMGKAKTWVLLADYEDNSLLRNKVAYALAEAVGLAYTSKTCTVDVYINNSYYGTYLLCEKVEIGDNRIGIHDLGKATEKENDKPLESYHTYNADSYRYGKSKGFQIPNNPQDITGGYLLELEKPDRYRPEVSGFATSRGQPIVIKEPEYVSREQADYILTYMQGFENAIFSKNGVDPESGKRYSEFVDMDSLSKKYVMEEISKNFDANRSSLYFYKPSDSESTVAFAGPVWDYDNAFGNFSNERTRTLKLPTGFSANSDRGENYYWFPALYRKKDFYAAAVKTYHEQFVPALRILLGQEKSSGNGLRSIQEYAAELEATAAMNFIRWPVFNSPSRQVKTGKDYAENISYLENFISGRMAFLSENWPLQ